MSNQHILGVEKSVNFAHVVTQAHLAHILEFGSEQLGLHFFGEEDVLNGHQFLLTFVDLNVQQIQQLFLLVQISIEFSTIGFSNKFQYAGFVQSFVLFLFEFQVAQRVGFDRQMMIANFLQQRLNNLLILVQQIVDVLPQLVVEETYFFIISFDLRILELPFGGQFTLHFFDILDGSFGVLVDIGLAAELAEQEFLFAILIQADEVIRLAMESAGFLRGGLVHFQI